jgi:hypothetical protein
VSNASARSRAACAASAADLALLLAQQRGGARVVDPRQDLAASTRSPSRNRISSARLGSRSGSPAHCWTGSPSLAAVTSSSFGEDAYQKRNAPNIAATLHRHERAHAGAAVGGSEAAARATMHRDGARQFPWIAPGAGSPAGSGCHPETRPSCACSRWCCRGRLSRLGAASSTTRPAYEDDESSSSSRAGRVATTACRSARPSPARGSRRSRPGRELLCSSRSQRSRSAQHRRASATSLLPPVMPARSSRPQSPRG